MWDTGQRRRIAGGQQENKGRESRWGGQGGGGDICQEGWLGSTSEGTEGRKNVSPAFLISLYPFNSLCLFLSARFRTTSGLTLSVFPSFHHHFWFPQIASLSPSWPGSICPLVFHPTVLFLFIAFYLSLPPTFHLCLFVCILTIFSLLHLFTGKELGVRSVPVQSRLCLPTKRVGVKHRHWHSLPGRWNHIEANGCRETWIYVCNHPLMQDLMSLVDFKLKWSEL